MPEMVVAESPSETVVAATVPSFHLPEAPLVPVPIVTGDAAAKVAVCESVTDAIVPMKPFAFVQTPLPTSVDAKAAVAPATPPPASVVEPTVIASVTAGAVTPVADLFWIVNVFAVALAETAENPPIANADAATSAIRFVIVFVDIIFLSRKVAVKNFFTTAWPRNAFS
jgi:hypothetical protein